jgi:putative ABC transport system permease protein
MWRLAIRGIMARKLRLALTAVSIVLGVAFVSGTFVLTDTLNATFDRIFGNAEAGVSVVVRGTESFTPSAGGNGSGAVDERGLVPDSVLTQVRAVPGVASAIGVANGYAQLVYHGKAVGNGSAPTLGSAWVGDVPANPLHVVRGRPPAADGEVLIDQHSADKFHIPVGAQAQAIAAGTTVPVTVVGVVRFGSDSTLAGAALTTFTPAQAQRLLLGQPGVWTTVQATAAAGVSQPVLAARIASALHDPTVQVMTAKAYVADQSKRFKDQLKFFNILLLVFAFIAVFVAVFIIFNTFTVLVAQRTRELALLRALGAGRGQVLGAVVGEAALVGLIAGVVGLLGGVLVAAGLRALIQVLSGGGLTTVSLQVQPRTVLVSIVVGFAVTVVAAMLPAIRASRIPPVAAMSDDYVLPAASLRRRTRLGAAALLIGVAVLVHGVSAGSALEIGIGAVAAFRGVVALSPLLARPIVGGLGRLLPRLWGTPGQLARENALRNPRRTAATASALMIGIALTTTMSIMAASIVTSANAAIDKSVGADFIITAKNFGPVPDTVARDVARVPGVGAVTSFREGAMKVGSATVQVQGVTPGSVADTLKLDVVTGSTSSLAAGDVLVDKQTATDKHLRVGSVLAVTFALTGKQQLTVGGIYAKNPIAGKYLIGLSTYERNFRNRLDIVVALKATSPDRLGAVRTALATVLKARPTLELRDQSEFKQNQKRQINMVLSFVLALLVLSLIIAWLGIVNTLALSVFERTREIGLLRAVGMRRQQVWTMIGLESVVIAVFGALLGVALGLGYGASLVQALHSQGIDQTSVPVGQLIAYLFVGAVAGFTAGLWPSHRAANLNVLNAIATE